MTIDLPAIVDAAMRPGITEVAMEPGLALALVGEIERLDTLCKGLQDALEDALVREFGANIPDDLGGNRSGGRR